MADQDHGEGYQYRTAGHRGLQPRSSPAYPPDSSIHQLGEKIQDPGIYRNGVCQNPDCYEVAGYRGTACRCQDCYSKFQQQRLYSNRADGENLQVNRPSIPSVSSGSQPRQYAAPFSTKPKSLRSGITSPPPSYSSLPSRASPSPHTAGRQQAPAHSLPATSPYPDPPREPVGGRYNSAPPFTGGARATSAQPIGAERMGEGRWAKGGGDVDSSAGGGRDRAGTRTPSRVQSQALGQDQYSAAYQKYPLTKPRCQNPYCSNNADPDCGGFCFSCIWEQRQGRETGPRMGHSRYGSSATSPRTAGRWSGHASRNLPRQDNTTVLSSPPVHVDVHDNTINFNIHPSAFAPAMWAPSAEAVPAAVRSIIPAIQGPPTGQARFPSMWESELETEEERIFSGREKELLSRDTTKRRWEHDV
ncbi:PREDICTED: cell wall protein RBR3-like [Branchiostoma belcheri]|uniref:Cell wall protein RBR3-like n=1 Tax=Branchiostoma belcheri TaxID=7741 RepID=A0A6P5A3E2_BRABE|nr:PREDICTED: cell wall protein RBR3-like [Branchiostoma belcheri]